MYNFKIGDNFWKAKSEKINGFFFLVKLYFDNLLYTALVFNIKLAWIRVAKRNKKEIQ